MQKATVLAISAALLVSSQAFGATLDSVQGKVFFNPGPGYRQLVGTAEAKPGDSAYAEFGGSARLVYADGCIVNIRPGSVVRVSEQSPCKSGALAPTGTPGAPIAAAAVVGGATAGVLLFIENDNNRPRPASP